MLKVNIQEAQTHLARYIDKAVEGDVILLCRHDRPVAELRAVVSSESSPPVRRRARVAGLLKGQVHWEPGTFDPVADDDEELAEFDRSQVFPTKPPQA